MTQLSVLVIRADGTTDTLATDASRLLRDLQQAVGGYLEGVSGVIGQSNTRTVMYLNEDGQALGLPLNPLATVVMRWLSPAHAGQYALGDVVICGVDGCDEVSVPASAVALVAEARRVLA